MNLVQAGYHLLVILSIVDGEYSNIEGEVILDYLTRNFDSTQFNLDTENRKIKALDKSQIADFFSKAASHFRQHSSPRRV